MIPPTCGDDAFSGVSACIVYVPNEKIGDYRQAEVWEQFTDIKELSYELAYKVDGETYKTYEVEYGESITAETEPTKEGYTFSGWSEIPETMPAHDVVVWHQGDDSGEAAGCPDPFAQW